MRISTQAEASGKTLSEHDIDREWESFLHEVEAIQVEQKALLQELVKSRRLKTDFIERIAESEVADYRELAEMLMNWKEPVGNDRTDQFMRQLNREDRLLGAVSRVDGLEVRGAEALKPRPAKDPE